MDYQKGIKRMTAVICNSWDAGVEKGETEVKIIYTPEKFLNAGKKLMRDNEKKKIQGSGNLEHK